MIIWYVICDVVIYKVCGRGESFCFHFDYGEGCWFGYSRVFLITQYLDGFLYIINTLRKGLGIAFLFTRALITASGGVYTHRRVSRGVFTHIMASGGVFTHISVSGGVFTHISAPGDVFTRIHVLGGDFMNIMASGGIFHDQKGVGRCFHAHKSVGRCFYADMGVGTCFHAQKAIRRCFHKHKGVRRCFHAHTVLYEVQVATHIYYVKCKTLKKVRGRFMHSAKPLKTRLGRVK